MRLALAGGALAALALISVPALGQVPAGYAPEPVGKAAPQAIPAEHLSPTTGAPDGVDWSGIWEPKPVPGTAWDWFPKDAPMTPDYKARYDKLRASMDAGHADFEPAANCEPLGMPRFMSNVYGMEIWHRSGMLGIYGEYPGFFRHIHIGREHPAPDDLDASYYGDSVAHWEGKDLVVDTVGIRGNVLLSRDGAMISDSAQVKERIHQVDQDTLTDTMTLIDPKALTRPWTIVKTYKRAPKNTESMEYFCTQNNRHPTNADGTVTTVLREGVK